MYPDLFPDEIYIRQNRSPNIFLSSATYTGNPDSSPDLSFSICRRLFRGLKKIPGHVLRLLRAGLSGLWPNSCFEATVPSIPCPIFDDMGC